MSFWRKLALLALAGFIGLVAVVVIAAVWDPDPQPESEQAQPAHTFVIE